MKEKDSHLMTPPNLYSIISNDSGGEKTESTVKEQSFSDSLYFGRLSECVSEIEKKKNVQNYLID